MADSAEARLGGRGRLDNRVREDEKEEEDQENDDEEEEEKGVPYALD
jgi:hypothetical protein